MSEIGSAQLHSELFRRRHSTRQSHGLFALAKRLLGRVALVRGVAAYSRQTFLWTICRSVGRSVGRSVRRSVGLSSTLWKNGGSDPDAVWRHRSDGSGDEAGGGFWVGRREGVLLGGKVGARHCNQWGLTFAATRPSSQITLGRLVQLIRNGSGNKVFIHVFNYYHFIV